jgi:hypothetical protein
MCIWSITASLELNKCDIMNAHKQPAVATNRLGDAAYMAPLTLPDLHAKDPFRTRHRESRELVHQPKHAKYFNYGSGHI